MKKITILSLLFITVFSVGAVLAHEYVAEGEYTTEVEFVNSANIDYSAVKKKRAICKGESNKFKCKRNEPLLR